MRTKVTRLGLKGDERVFVGKLVGPLEVGHSIMLEREDLEPGFGLRTSMVQKINDNIYQTRNSLYRVEEIE